MGRTGARARVTGPVDRIKKVHSPSQSRNLPVTFSQA
jgi:hypothetical protein